MAPRWLDSADKHGVSRGDQMFAMLHPTFAVRLPDPALRGGAIWLFIGWPHEQASREIEVLAEVFTDGREAVVFHAMPLGSKYRRYREERSN